MSIERSGANDHESRAPQYASCSEREKEDAGKWEREIQRRREKELLQLLLLSKER